MSQLTLWGTEPTKGRCEARAEDQVARCAVALAAREIAERPRFRRCELCDGREDTTDPHMHGVAA